LQKPASSTLRVPMSKRLSLRVSLHWLYNSIPALEDNDLVAQVLVVDPDGIPGNGDEYFETVDTGGFPIDAGTTLERREKLDTMFTTSLGLSF